MLVVYWKIIFDFISSVKNLYGRFWETSDGLKEYYLKLDGYFYSPQKNCNVAVVRVRNKRTVDLIPIKEIVNDKGYLQELHPADACVIGIIANDERNGIINKKYNGWRKMCRIKEGNDFCFVKSQPVLEITKTYINEEGIEITVLKAQYLQKLTEIPTIELCKNPALLYALNSFQAISVGYNASEFIFRKKLN